MQRWLCVRTTVFGDPKRLKETLVAGTPALLQAATGTPLTPPAGDGSFELVLHPRAVGVDLSKTVTAKVGEIVERDAWMKIPFSWEGGTLAAFPSFDGALEIEDVNAEIVGLSLIGTYEPPAGPLGALADATVLVGVAERTGERLLEAVARTLRTMAEAGGEVPRPKGSPRRMTVRDVMSAGDVLVFPEDMALRSAANLLLLGRISGAPVVDGDGQLVGVLSESDLLDKVAPEQPGLGRRAALSWQHHAAVTVGEACSRPPHTTQADTELRDAAAEMAQLAVGRLVVLDGAKVAGIVTRTDVLKALVRSEDDLEAAIRDVLASSPAFADVVVELETGTAKLTGHVQTHSQALQLVQALIETDGVLEVLDDELAWEVDDTIPPPLVG